MASLGFLETGESMIKNRTSALAENHVKPAQYSTGAQGGPSPHRVRWRAQSCIRIAHIWHEKSPRFFDVRIEAPSALRRAEMVSSE
jgi:hypothetical protein